MADFINTIDALGDDAVVDSIINRTITEFKDDKLTYLGDSAFYNCTQLKEVDLPNVLYLYASVFRGCTSLETVNLPEFIGLADNRYDNHWFGGCTSLRSITLPKVTVVGQQYAFSGCTSLEYVDLPMATKIPTMCFDNCRTLKALILRRIDGIATLVNANAIPQSAPVYIYVPSALADSYKAAANWSTYANQFRNLEEWTVDGTVTGRLIFDNIVPTAINPYNGEEIYEGVGYKDGVYIAGQDESAVAGYVSTGSIYLPSDVKSIYIKGCAFDTSVYSRMYFGAKETINPTSTFTIRGDGSGSATLDFFFTVENVSEDCIKLTLNSNALHYGLHNRYYRLTLKGSGANLIVIHD